MASSIERAVARFRAALIRGEADVARLIIGAYDIAWRRLQADVDAVIGAIRQARAAGTVVDDAWLRQLTRYQSLQRQIEFEVAGISRLADARITQAQAQAVAGGSQQAIELMDVALGRTPPGVTVGFNVLPTSETRALIGALGDGSPLRSLLDELGPESADAVEKALIEGLTRGHNPRRIARDMHTAFNVSQDRALTIARTEVLRAYRSAAWETYKQHEHLLEGWIWVAELSISTCAACWMMHGTIHDTDEFMPFHVNCRCSMSPRTKSWEDLGFEGIEDTRPEIRPGVEVLEELSDADKATILGPAKFVAWRNDEFTLKQIVRIVDDPAWGRSVQTRSLKSLVGAERANEYIASLRTAIGAA